MRENVINKNSTDEGRIKKNRMDEVAVLIPCYNESKTIEKVVTDFRRELPDAVIYVYDNNSTDNTVEIAKQAGAVVRHEYQQGKGNVVRRMFQEIDANCYILVDGDDTYPAESAGEMVRLVMEEMQEVLKEKNVPVITSAPYSNMANYSKMEEFLFRAEQDLPGDIVLYRINRDGGIERLKFNYDGTDMYLLAVKAVWGMNDNPSIVYVSYTRIEEWKYTEKGWFGYTLCVPKYPEVSEAVDGSSMIRIKPLSDECREVSKRCVYLLGYQGNNLLCSDWDRSDMEGLDYNGLYEYLYRMKYGERYEFSGNSSGIPAEEFENLIMEFLPITAEQIKKWAVFDSEHQTYDWEQFGCFNYSFGTSLPEVVEIRDSGEGNNVLVVDAVCDTFICNDAVITSELTVKFNDDKSFKYMGNKILNNGTKEVPKYQYRIKRKN